MLNLMLCTFDEYWVSRSIRQLYNRPSRKIMIRVYLLWNVNVLERHIYTYICHFLVMILVTFIISLSNWPFAWNFSKMSLGLYCKNDIFITKQKAKIRSHSAYYRWKFRNDHFNHMNMSTCSIEKHTHTQPSHFQKKIVLGGSISKKLGEYYFFWRHS